MPSESTANWRGRRVLVTGAGGFIGSHLTEALVRAGAKVRALHRYTSNGSWGLLEALPVEVRSEVEVVLGDIRDPLSVTSAVDGCGWVFHLAALIGIPYSYTAPDSYVQTNVVGTLNVLQACRAQGIERIVQTSTSEVYGTARYVPMDENHPLQAQSPYAATKIAADKLTESFHLSFGLPVTTVRPFNTFGPRQSTRAVIPTLAAQIVGGASKVFAGSLDTIRDFTFVTDTAAGFLAVAGCPNAIGQTLNLGTGTGVTIEHVGRLLLARAGSRASLYRDEQRVRPGASEVLRLVSDTRKVQGLTDWQPRVSLEEGLGRVLESLRQPSAVLRPEIYRV
jgi:NAD dependent epimerase/dehydratase